MRHRFNGSTVLITTVVVCAVFSFAAIGTTGQANRVPRIAGKPNLNGIWQTGHAWPDLLPGDRAVLFTILGATVDEAQIAVLDLESGQQKVLLQGGSHPRYSSTGHIVYGIDGTLRRLAYDV